ncbi:metallophosphoesterase family protein [Companilactobacillus jidongensis]|uniref:metallophosphoesterase family protein n=1 Tax=Companilactobacillus jidongensis TaxID=2486006 RepID=UPI000F7A250B|nr:metallophosphoesterase family protein [Companilactobacillus jidongensis]
MTRIALLSDVHGDITALQAVVKNLEKEKIEESWYLGDLLMPGPGTNELFEMLDSVNTTVLLRGNWDNFLFEDVSKLTERDLKDPVTPYILMLMKYTLNKTKPEYLDKLKTAPIYKSLDVNGSKILLTHNTKKRNFGHELLPYQSQANFDDLFDDIDYDLAVYGHTHHQIMRTSSKDQLIINPGSIGQPYTERIKFRPDRRAQYAIIDIDKYGYTNIEFKKISYDVNHELELAKEMNLPYIELYKKLFTEGIAYTHDQPELKKYMELHDYKSEAMKFYKQLLNFE